MLPAVEVFYKNFGEVDGIIDSAVMLACKFKTFRFHHCAKASAARQPLEIGILLPQVDMVVEPVILQPV
jgi:hypothetical protein